MTPRRILLVGGSLAATRVVRALRRKGYDGELVVVGAERHLPYDRPPLSKDFLAGRAEADGLRYGDDVFWDGVELHLGVSAQRLVPGERRVELTDGTSLRGDHVVIATGATPRRLPGQPDAEGVFLLRTLDDATALRDALDARPEGVVVVGAGFIGSEVASTARERGLDVTVLELDQAPVVRGVGRVIGGALAQLQRDAGVDLRLGVGVDSLETTAGRVTGVRLGDGTLLPADVVVVGIGVAPATGWLDGAGLRLEDGVVTDDRCRAVGGGEHVWALGDVARWPSRRYGELLRVEHWTNATEQAAVVAANLLDPDGAPTHDPVPYVWSDQFGEKFQVLGRVRGDDDVEVLAGALDGERFLAGFFRNGRLQGVVGRSWPRAVMTCKPLLEDLAPRAAVVEHATSL